MFRRIPFIAGGGYSGKVLSYSPIAYWQLNETSGAAAVCSVNAAQNGTYTGVTLASSTGPDGQPVPLFDGANDFVSIYSAAFNTAWDGDEGAAVIWVKSLDWTTDNQRFLRIGRSASEEIEFQIGGAVAGRMYFERVGSTTSSRVTVDTGSPTGWTCMGMAWSKAGDTFKAYQDGSQTGATQNGLGAWVEASLLTANCAIGAQSTAPDNPCNAYIAHVAVFTNPAVDMAALATV